jgi:hypothetical protein
MRFRRPTAPPDPPRTTATGPDAGGDATAAPAAAGRWNRGRQRMRRVAGRAATPLAGLLVLFALLVPNQITHLTPGAFLRIPVDGLLAAVLLLVLPATARTVAATAAGLALGLVTIVKLLDMGFYAVFDRAFDPVLDWSFFGPALEFLRQQVGRTGALAAAGIVIVLAVALVVLTTLSVRHLTRRAVPYAGATSGTVAVLAAVSLVGTGAGVPVLPDPGAATLAYDTAVQVRAGLLDGRAYAEEAAVDAFRDTPGQDLLTALRGKDVVVAFIESYGRVAVEKPEYAPHVAEVLDSGYERLRAAGFTARSAFLTSSTAGGGSWLAHSTLLSGVWINNQNRYKTLVTGDRFTLNGAFRRAGWRTVAVMPGVTQDWPEGGFYGYDKIYTARDVGYRGPLFTLATMPDQYTWAAFERAEHGKPRHAPLMAEVPLTSSHAPWAPVPRLIDWKDVGDGSIFNPMAYPASDPKVMLRNASQIRTDYRLSIEYSLNTLVSYLVTYGDDNLVMVFLGDHQPSPLITGPGAGRDVPVTIVARDRAVLDRVSDWGWNDGLRPDPQAPVWPMNTFRDRFLTAFGPQVPR